MLLIRSTVEVLLILMSYSVSVFCEVCYQSCGHVLIKKLNVIMGLIKPKKEQNKAYEIYGGV